MKSKDFKKLYSKYEENLQNNKTLENDISLKIKSLEEEIQSLNKKKNLTVLKKQTEFYSEVKSEIQSKKFILFKLDVMGESLIGITSLMPVEKLVQELITQSKDKENKQKIHKRLRKYEFIYTVNVVEKYENEFQALINLLSMLEQKDKYKLNETSDAIGENYRFFILKDEDDEERIMVEDFEAKNLQNEINIKSKTLNELTSEHYNIATINYQLQHEGKALNAEKKVTKIFSKWKFRTLESNYRNLVKDNNNITILHTIGFIELLLPLKSPADYYYTIPKPQWGIRGFSYELELESLKEAHEQERIKKNYDDFLKQAEINYNLRVKLLNLFEQKKFPVSLIRELEVINSSLVKIEEKFKSNFNKINEINLKLKNLDRLDDTLGERFFYFDGGAYSLRKSKAEKLLRKGNELINEIHKLRRIELDVLSGPLIGGKGISFEINDEQFGPFFFDKGQFNKLFLYPTNKCPELYKVKLLMIR